MNSRSLPALPTETQTHRRAGSQVGHPRSPRQRTRRSRRADPAPEQTHLGPRQAPATRQPLGTRSLDRRERLCRPQSRTPSESVRLLAAQTRGLRHARSQSGKTQQVYRGHTGPVTSLDFYAVPLASGRTREVLISGSWDKSFRVWDVQVRSRASGDFFSCRWQDPPP